MPIVNRKTFAEFIGYSPRQVGDWLDLGMPCVRTGKKGAEVRIESAAAIQWLLQRDQDENQSARLRRAQADKLERENQIAEGQLIPLLIHEQMIIAITQTVLQILCGMPGRLASEVAVINEPAIARDRLMREVLEIRTAIAGSFGKAAEMLSETVRQLDLESSYTGELW